MRRALGFGPPLVIFLVLFAPRTGGAQNLGEFEFNYSPGVDLRDPEPDLEGVRLEFTRFRAGFRLPIPLTTAEGRETFLLAGGGYEFLLTEATQDQGETFVRRQELHGVELQLGLIRSFGPRWTLVANFAPGFAGDFVDVDGDGFRFQGVLLAAYRLSGAVTLGGGIVATTAFGQPLPLPGLTFEYRKPRFRIDAFLPLRLDFVFPVHEVVELGIAARVSGNNYDISNQEPIEAARFSQLDLSAFISLGLSDTVWLVVTGGPVLGRRFDFVDDDGDTLQDLATNLAGMIRVRLEVRSDFEARTSSNPDRAPDE